MSVGDAMTCIVCNSDHYRRERGVVRDTLTCGVCGDVSEAVGTGVKVAGAISSFVLSVIYAAVIVPQVEEPPHDG